MSRVSEALEFAMSGNERSLEEMQLAYPEIETMTDLMAALKAFDDSFRAHPVWCGVEAAITDESRKCEASNTSVSVGNREMRQNQGAKLAFDTVMALPSAWIMTARMRIQHLIEQETAAKLSEVRRKESENGGNTGGAERETFDLLEAPRGY